MGSIIANPPVTMRSWHEARQFSSLPSASGPVAARAKASKALSTPSPMIERSVFGEIVDVLAHGGDHLRPLIAGNEVHGLAHLEAHAHDAGVDRAEGLAVGLEASPGGGRLIGRTHRTRTARRLPAQRGDVLALYLRVGHVVFFSFLELARPQPSRPGPPPFPAMDSTPPGATS